jgi:16S rRNA (uracil1498-N3)-methyltransferase
MPRFFVPAAQVAGGRARIEGDDASHLARSLRAAPGERLVLADDAGMEHGVLLDGVSPSLVTGVVCWSRRLTGEAQVEVHVVQALPKDGMDELVEALAEAGASALWPALTRRTVARPDAQRAAHRVARWQAIARSAAMLAGRGRVPVVHAVVSLPAVLQALPADARLLVCVPSADVAVSQLQPGPRAGDRVAVVIGPEGGFDAEEIELLRERGAQLVHLGPRVLRARLAGVVALTALLASSGDLDSPVAEWPSAEVAAP